MLNEMQEAEVWKRVLGEEQPQARRPEPIPRPYPTKPIKPEPIPRPYPTEPVKPEPIPRPYPTEPVNELTPARIMELLHDAMEASRTYKELLPQADARQKPILRQLATVQEQQCHRLLTLLQLSV